MFRPCSAKPATSARDQVSSVGPRAVLSFRSSPSAYTEMLFLPSQPSSIIASVTFVPSFAEKLFSTISSLSLEATRFSLTLTTYMSFLARLSLASIKLDPVVSSQSLSFLIGRNQEPVLPSFLEAHSALGLSGRTMRGLPLPLLPVRFQLSKLDPMVVLLPVSRVLCFLGSGSLPDSFTVIFPVPSPEWVPSVYLANE